MLLIFRGVYNMARVQMKKLNMAGFVVFLITAGFTVLTLAKPSSMEVILLPFVMTLLGVFLISIDWRAGNTKFGVFLIAVLWFCYWGLAALSSLSLAGLAGFVAGMGHGGIEAQESARLHMYSYFGISLLFCALATANFIKFVLAILFFPKSQVN